MRFALAFALPPLLFIAGLTLATGFIAGVFDGHPALGAPLFGAGGEPVYSPFAVIAWTEAHAENFPKPFAIARLIVLAAFAVAILAFALLIRTRTKPEPFGKDAWGKFADAEEAGLFAKRGTPLGKLDGEILCFDGPEHQLLVGASRSGKGRGHVVPTLLAWPGSALVLDVKGELASGDGRHGFPGTAGFRATRGPVLQFAPTQASSARFNPLFEVRRGANEVRDVQNIVDIIADLSLPDLHNPGRIAGIGTELFGRTAELGRGMNILTDFVPLVTILIAAFVIMFGFFILALQIFSALIAFKLGSLAAFVALPWGVFSGTAWVAERPLGWVVGSAMRLFVLALIASVSISFVDRLPAVFVLDAGGALNILLFGLTLLMLAWFGPQLASEVVSGQPHLSGADTVRAGQGAAATAAGAAVTTRLVMSGGGRASLTFVALQKRTFVHVVEVAPEGQVLSVRVADGAWTPGTAQTAYFIGEFVRNVRALPTDQIVLRENWLAAYQFLTPQAAAKLSEIARQDDPFANTGLAGRTVHVRSIVQRSDKSWQVSWSEETGHAGRTERANYTGLFTVTHAPPRSADEISKNPLGLFITEFSWSRDQ